MKSNALQQCGVMALLLVFCSGWVITASSSTVSAANRNSPEMVSL